MPEKSTNNDQQTTTQRGIDGRRLRLLCEFYTGGVDRHRQMSVAGSYQTQAPLQPNLARGRIK